MLGNPAPAPSEISFPHERFLNEEILPRNSLSPPTPFSPVKSPLKTSLCFPIVNTMCKQWGKFITCSPTPMDLGVEGLSHPQIHSY